MGQGGFFRPMLVIALRYQEAVAAHVQGVLGDLYMWVCKEAECISTPATGLDSEKPQQDMPP